VWHHSGPHTRNRMSSRWEQVSTRKLALHILPGSHNRAMPQINVRQNASHPLIPQLTKPLPFEIRYYLLA
jgi:hypothetical protein